MARAGPPQHPEGPVEPPIRRAQAWPLRGS